MNHKSWFPKFAFCSTFLTFSGPKIVSVPSITRSLSYPSCLKREMSVVDIAKGLVVTVHWGVLIVYHLWECFWYVTSERIRIKGFVGPGGNKNFRARWLREIQFAGNHSVVRVDVLQNFYFRYQWFIFPCYDQIKGMTTPMGRARYMLNQVGRFLEIDELTSFCVRGIVNMKIEVTTNI